jgi:histidine kinase-like protein/STAS domain-containing protein
MDSAGQTLIKPGYVGDDNGVNHMAGRSHGRDDGARRRWDRKGGMTPSLLLNSRFQGDTLVVQPIGELAPETYEQLRDGLLKCAVEEPEAIVVDVGGLRTAIASLLTVFPMVCDRINDWPGVPLVLAAARPALDTLLDFSAVPRFVQTYRTVSEALEGLEAGPRRLRRQIQLSCEPVSARLARRLVEQACLEWGIAGMVTDAMVVASELTDNMVYHARSDGWLRLELRGNTLAVAVADADPHPPRLRVPGLRAAGGRGLVLVDKLSRTWGSAFRFPEGKVVWAVLTVPARTRTRAHSGCGSPTSMRLLRG